MIRILIADDQADVLVYLGEPRHREFTQDMRALQRIRKEL